jgi:hypothetical protein
MSYNLIKDGFLRQAQQQIQEQNDNDPGKIAQAYKEHFARMGQDQSEPNLMDTPSPAKGSSQSSAVFNALTQGNEARRGQAEKSDAPAQSDESPLDRWKRGVESLLTSGNSSLIKQGESMLQAYHQKASSTSAGGGGTNDYKNYMHMTKPADRSPEGFKKYMSDKSIQKVMNVSERGNNMATTEEKIKFNVNPDSNYYWDKGILKPVAKGAEDELTGQMNTIDTSIGMMDDMLFGEDGLMNNYQTGVGGRISEIAKANFQLYAKEDDRYGGFDSFAGGMLSTFARGLGGEKGSISDGDVARVSGLLPKVTGLNPDTPASARKKMNKLKRLAEVKKRKGGLTSADINEIIGSVPGSDNELPPPPPGITWVEDE